MTDDSLPRLNTFLGPPISSNSLRATRAPTSGSARVVKSLPRNGDGGCGAAMIARVKLGASSFAIDI